MLSGLRGSAAGGGAMVVCVWVSGCRCELKGRGSTGELESKPKQVEEAVMQVDFCLDVMAIEAEWGWSGRTERRERDRVRW